MAGRRVALVTGSAAGIGRAAAWQFAEAGYDVMVNYSRSQAEAEETADGVRSRGTDVRVVRADAGADEEVRGLVASTRDAFGRLDALVNNAATTRFIAHRDLDALTEEVWDSILQLNVKGLFYACRAAMPLLQESRGAIVNVASVAGIAGSGSSIPYAASKGAVITMTKSLARAFAPEVRVNAVAPGPVQTRWLADHQDMIEQAMTLTPLQRPASPDDIAEAILYLADRATLTTGQILVIDGGRTM
ncbi:SDR family oxidoreductase [Tautonia sp. JC769]|uniref:SDR family NAD(P)-dependent oxidoreductase n=1 Tax=Tautonia sp. JC769 TaxID=3232135 RepID=UPI00345A2D35